MSDENTLEIKLTVDTSQAVEAREAEKAGYRAVAQAATDAQRAIAAEQQRTHEKQKTATLQLLNQEEAMTRARIELIREANREAIEAAKNQIRDTKLAAESTTSWHFSIKDTIGSLQSLVGVGVGLAGVAQSVGLISQKFDEVQKHAMESVKAAIAFREQLKEIASLTGSPNVDAETVKRELDLRSQTLQKSGDLTQMQSAALGSAGSSIGDEADAKINKKNFNEAMIGTGQLQAIKGTNATAIGDMLGAVIQNTPGNQISGKAVTQQMYSLFNVADAGNMKPEQFANSFTELAPMVKDGNVKGIGDLAALMSTMSKAGAGNVTTRVNQLQRLTKGALGETGKPGGAVMSTSEYLASIGANDQQTMTDILQLMASDVDKQKAELAKSGKTLSLDTYMRERGYGSMEDINAFRAFNSNKELYQNKFTPLAQQLPSEQQIATQVRQFELSPEGFNAVQSLREDQQRIGAGVGAPEYALGYKKELFSRLKQRDDNKVWGAWKGDFQEATSGISGRMFFKEEMIQDLSKKASAAGLSEESFGTGMSNPFLRLRNSVSGSREESELLTGILQKIGGAGGQMTGSQESTDIFRQQLESARATEGYMKDIATRLPAVPALQAQPGGANGGGRMP